MENNFYKINDKNEIKKSFIEAVKKYNESKKALMPAEKYETIINEKVNPILVKIEAFDMNHINAENNIIYQEIKTWFELREKKEIEAVCFMNIAKKIN